MIGLVKPTVVKYCHEFVAEFSLLQDELINFTSMRAGINKKIEGFAEKSKIPNVVAINDYYLISLLENVKCHLQIKQKRLEKAKSVQDFRMSDQLTLEIRKLLKEKSDHERQITAI